MEGQDRDARPSGSEATAGGPIDAEQVDAVMLAMQALVGMAARSVADVEDQVTLPQLRVLVLVAGHEAGSMNVSAVAKAMDIHVSNASRSCDRLVAAGLLSRAASATDRRNTVLDLTQEGEQLLERLIEGRRAVAHSVLERLPPPRRRAVADVLTAFSHACGEEALGEVWKLGWHR